MPRITVEPEPITEQTTRSIGFSLPKRIGWLPSFGIKTDDDWISARLWKCSPSERFLLAPDAVFVSVQLHDEAHEFTVRRDGQPLLVRHEHPHHSECQCALAAWLRSKLMTDQIEGVPNDEIKLTGIDANMIPAQFREIFNDAAKEITPETPSEVIVERIHKMEDLIRKLRTHVLANRTAVNDRLETANAEERERIRKADRQYKPKVQIPTEAKPRATAKNQTEKAQAALASLGLDLDSLIAEAKAKKAGGQ